MEDMESFFEAVIVFFGIIISLVASAKKAKNKRVAKAARNSSFPKEESVPAKPDHPYTPAQPIVLPLVPAADLPGQVVAPTVHTHLQPDCDTHDAPSGSLGVKSPEGKDPCHEPQLTHARFVQEPEEEEVGLTFDWSGENMVKAFVMQEILTRPVNRTPIGQRAR